MDSPKFIFRPYITVKGRRIYAKEYGKRAFKIPVDYMGESEEIIDESLF